MFTSDFSDRVRSKYPAFIASPSTSRYLVSSLMELSTA